MTKKLRANATRKIDQLFKRTDHAVDVSDSDYDEPVPISVAHVKRFYHKANKNNWPLIINVFEKSGGWGIFGTTPKGYKEYTLYFKEEK